MAVESEPVRTATAELENLLEQREAVLAESRRTIEELTAANRRLEYACNERLALIEEQALALADQATALASLQSICDERAALLESQAASIAGLTQECRDREAEISRLHATAEERLSVIEVLDAALERLPDEGTL